MKPLCIVCFCLLIISTVTGTQLHRIHTDSFDIIYQSGLEEFALQLYREGPPIYDALCAYYGYEPRKRVRVYLLDQGDFANAYADIFSHMTAIYINRMDTRMGQNHFLWWVPFVFSHELTHILIADKPGVIKDSLAVFGTPVSVLFDTAFSPAWLHEGACIVSESILFEQGRLHDSRFSMFLRAALLDNQFRGLQLAGGMNSPVYTPIGEQYLYGAWFFAYLIDVYGEEAYRQFIVRYGTEYRYNLRSAIKGITGHQWDSFLDDWERWAWDAVGNPLENPVEGAPVQEGRYQSGLARLFRSSVIVIDRPLHTTSRWLQTDHLGQSRIFRNDPLPIDFDVAPSGRVAAVYAFGDGLERFQQELYLEDESGVLVKASNHKRVTQVRWIDDDTLLLLVLDRGGSTLIRWHLSDDREETLIHGSPDFLINGFSWYGSQMALSVTFDQQTHLYLWEDDHIQGLFSTDSVAIDPFLTDEALFFSWDQNGVFNIYSLSFEEKTLTQHTRVKTGAFQPIVMENHLYYRGYDASGYALYHLTLEEVDEPVKLDLDTLKESSEKWVLTDRLDTMLDPSDIERHAPPYTPLVEPRVWTPIALAGGTIAPGFGILGWDDLKQTILYAGIGTYGQELFWEWIWVDRGPVNFFFNMSGAGSDVTFTAQLAVPTIDRGTSKSLTIYPHLQLFSKDLFGKLTPENTWFSGGVDFGFGVMVLPRNLIAVNDFFTSFSYEKGMRASVGKGFVLPFESLGIAYMRIQEFSSPVAGLSVWTPIPLSPAGTSEGKYQFHGLTLRTMMEVTPEFPYIAGGIGLRMDFQIHYWLSADITVDLIASPSGIHPAISFGSGGFFLTGLNPYERPKEMIERFW